ncbi:hypothetical protein YC2023_008949 [Brassica napus]
MNVAREEAHLSSQPAKTIGRNARIQRVRQAITYAARAPPVILTKITPDLDKGKGHVFDYPDISSLLQWHATKKLKITSSARLTLLENESETESSTASLPALLPPFDITTGFQLGISSKDPTAGDGKGDKKARRRPPSGKRKTQVRAVGTARNSTQNEENNRENGLRQFHSVVRVVVHLLVFSVEELLRQLSYRQCRS